MLRGTYYSQEFHGPYERFDIGDPVLEEGGTLRGCSLAFATFGTLNASRDNAILVPTWFSGTSKIMEQVFIGPGRALDPKKYFIVVVSQVGNGLSTSPHNTDGADGRSGFLSISISDDVRAQHRLLTQKLGISELSLVFGASMGAQKTYEWAVRYPDMVKRAAPLAGTARNTAHDFLFTQTLMDVITSNPAFDGGWCDSNEAVHAGLRRHAHLWAVTSLCGEFYSREIRREAGFSSKEDLVVNFMEAYFLPMDPNDLLCMGWKWQRGDVARITDGDRAAALGRVTAKACIMAVTSDLVFPVVDFEAQQRLVAGSTFCAIQSNCGHFGFVGMEQSFKDQVDHALIELLAADV